MKTNLFRHPLPVCAVLLAMPLAATPCVATPSIATPLPAQDEDIGGAIASAPRELLMLRLYDGSILWGSILGHDVESLYFERLDTGGKVHLPWARLDPQLAEQMLEQYGYVDHSGDEVMVEADRLLLTDNTEIIGQIINRTASELWIKTATRTFPVPMLKLRGAATRVTVPARDVFTTDELYQAEASRLDPTSAQALWDLSVYCERIYDFAHAVEQLKAAALLDPAFKPAEIAQAIARNEGKVKDQVQLEALRAIDFLRVRGKFDEAVRQIEAFLTTYETSPYRADATKKRAQVEKAREQKLRDKTVELWHVWLGRLVQAKARESGSTLEAAIGYLDEALGKAVIERVTADLQKTVSADVTPDRVTKYWSEREGGKWRHASYGQGTFLLGDAEARKGLVKEEEQAKPASETDTARKQLEERIARYLKNQEFVKKAKGGNQDEEDAQQNFWAEYLSYSRAQWMLAYYVEHSGDFQLREPLFTNCPDCGGTGTREILNAMGRQNSSSTGQAPTGGSTQLVDCPTCHRVGVFRRVSYR